MVSFALLISVVGATAVNQVGTNGIEIVFSFDEFSREEYSFPEAVWFSQPGEPNVPSLTYKVGIPQDGGVEVSVVGHTETVLKDVVVEPAYYVGVDEGAVSGAKQFYADVYRQNRYFPDSVVVVSAPGYFRDLYTVDVRVNPVRYNPVTRELKVSRNIKVNIEFTGQPKIRRAVDGAYDQIYSQTVINYEQCRDWQRIPNPVRRNPFAGSVWFKINVRESGLYKIGQEEIRDAGLDPDQFDPRTMKIYTAPFDVLPRTVPLPDSLDSLIEIPAYVHGADDGVFDAEDYLIFYGYAASHFVPDTGIVWYENGYAVDNVYWFTFGGADGRRMEQVDAAWNGTVPDTTVNAISHNEIDLSNPSRSGTNWYWADVSPLTGAQGVAQVMVAHPGATGTAQARAALFTLDTATFWYRFALGGVTFFSDTLFVPAQSSMPPVFMTGTGSLSGDSSAFLFEVTRPAGVLTSLTAYLNAVDINYQRRSVLDAPYHVSFTAPGQYSIRCDDAGTQPVVIDVTDLHAPRMLSNLTLEGSTMRLSGTVDSIQMLYFSKLSFVESAVLVSANPGRLRTVGDGCDYIMIVHEDFYNAIMPLVEYRSREYLTKVVTVDDIYDDFSFGRFDPLAIKHFLHYTTDNWSPYPKYVLLVGDATYDYKNNLGKENPPNFVPMYEYGTALSGDPVFIDNVLYEGEYVNFGQGEAMCLGRITVRTRQEVRDFIDKLINYETGDIVGPWTKRVILSADDEFAYNWESVDHTAACESNLTNIPDSLYDFAKVYMISYPPLGYGTAEKANAREAFIREFNKGALLGVFYGHGNTHQLAHEVLFLSPYIGRIKNGRRLPFFYFGSCNVGRFDDSDYECLGEEFVRIREGAIGTIAATAGTGTGTNTAIGGRLCTYITRPDTTLTMGECSVIARSIDNWASHYLLIGDPATKFRKMYQSMYFTPASDSVRPVEMLDILCDNNRYHLKAFVRDTTHIEKFDATTADKISGYVFRLVQVSDIPTYVPYGYYIDGKEVYTGYWDSDTATLIAPRVSTVNLPVLKLSGIYGGRSGVRDSIRIYGTALPTTDYAGPEVTLYDGGRELKDGDWVEKKFKLTGRVADSSGLNLLYSVESTNGFFLYVNSNLDSKIDLRDYFFYDKNSFTAGEFTVEVDLPEMVDTLTINVVDNNFNQTVQRISLNAELFGQIAINDFLIYPNPLRTEDGLWFTFNITRGGLALIKIFTIAGRLVKTIGNVTCVPGYNQIYWDGRDSYGDAISNGVYIVKAYVEADNSRDDALEKFIIAR
jgi:hypothetical protein